MRTLIVDDSPVIRILLQRILRSYGESEFAKDGQEAVDTYNRSLLEGSPFDLVCLDLGLPVISGAEVLDRIRAAEVERGSVVKARILVITASSELLQVDSVQRQGADGYLVKPIDRQKLDTYLLSFGFQPIPDGTDSAENPLQRFETMCDLDAIPVSVLVRLIQRMAVSINRQLSNTSSTAASTS